MIKLAIIMAIHAAGFYFLGGIWTIFFTADIALMFLFSDYHAI